MKELKNENFKLQRELEDQKISHCAFKEEMNNKLRTIKKDSKNFINGEIKQNLEEMK